MLISAVSMQADVWDGVSSDKSWYDSAETVFHIKNAAQLKGFADIVNDDKVNFDNCEVHLDEDIDLNNCQWTPIGFGNVNFTNAKFNGEFKGHGKLISNLYIDCSLLPYDSGWATVGFFGNFYGTMSNLNMRGQIIVNNTDYIGYKSLNVGGLCAYGEGQVLDCTCDMDIYSTVNMQANSFASIGVAVGKAAFVSNIKISGHIEFEYSFCGGFGSIFSAEKIYGCESSIDLNMNSYPSSNWANVGGIASYCDYVENCIFKGNWCVGGQYGDGMLGGIVASANYVKNVIFAPVYSQMTLRFNPDWMAYSSLNEICPASDAYIEDAYYTVEWEGTNHKGTFTTEDSLKSGLALPNFSTEIWDFTSGKLPSLKAFAQDYIIDVPVGNGSIGMLAKEGDSMTIRITPDLGWSVCGFYVDGVDMTSDMSGNDFTFEDINRNHVVDVIFEKDPAGVESIAASDRKIKINVRGDIVTVSNIDAGCKILVANIDGKIENKFEPIESSYTFNLNKGIHIISVGGSSYKVMIR